MISQGADMHQLSQCPSTRVVTLNDDIAMCRHASAIAEHQQTWIISMQREQSDTPVIIIDEQTKESRKNEKRWRNGNKKKLKLSVESFR